MSTQPSSALNSKSRSLTCEWTAATSEFNNSCLTLVQKHPYNKDSSALTSFFNEICPLSEEAIVSIHEQTRAVFFKKGQSLSKPSAKNDNLFFILKGVVRGYVKHKGEDITLWINADHEMVGSIPVLGILLPSDQHLQALEDSILVQIPQTLIEYLCEHFSEASLIGRALIEDHNRCTMEGDSIRRITSPEEKLKKFNESLPELSDRIPLEYIASYLAMPPDTLIRLRAEMGDVEYSEETVPA